MQKVSIYITKGKNAFKSSIKKFAWLSTFVSTGKNFTNDLSKIEATQDELRNITVKTSKLYPKKEMQFPYLGIIKSKTVSLLEGCIYYLDSSTIYNEANKEIEYYTFFIASQKVFFIVRLNSNIYKNIFPESVFNMDVINRIKDGTTKEFIMVEQVNHGFSLYDVLYLDEEIYYKATANPDEYHEPVGIVYKIHDDNKFDLLITGMMDYEKIDLDDSGILYLSDKIPGKIVPYKEISNTTYVPIAIYSDKSIIVNIQQGSTGMELSPYNNYEPNFESYSNDELDSVINTITAGVIK